MKKICWLRVEQCTGFEILGWVWLWEERGKSHEEEPQEGKKVGDATEVDGAKLKLGGEG